MSTASRRPTPSVHRSKPRAGTLPGLLLGLGGCLALWALLSGNQGWEFGVPLALLATWVGVRANFDVGAVRLRYLPAFLGFFLCELFIGGWDVARRAWHPRLPIQPQWVSYSMSSEEPRVQLLLSALVGLLPGTFASHFTGQTLHIHALDHRQNWQDTVQQLEQHLQRLLPGAQA